MRILVIEDDPSIAKLLRLTLERDSYDVAHASSGREGLKLVHEWEPDVVLLDLMLPDVNGREVAREIRGASDIPIVMVTALGQETDRVAGLDVGADDYVVKPFSIAELKARLRALTRRAKGDRRRSFGPLHVGDLTLDTDEHRVARGMDEISLTKREFEILRMLMAHPGKLVSRATLAHAIWGRDATSAANLLDVHVSALRKKLDDDPSGPAYIETVRGEGFRLRREEEEVA
jgi:two-component system response regulator VicR